jgi:SAM-dependent methyltransferase
MLSQLQDGLDRIVRGLKRRTLSKEIDRRYAALVATLDHAAIATELRPYWEPFPGIRPAKFLHMDVWLREALFRYLLLDIPQERLNVLDLGAGCGYFLLVCRQAGHTVMGLDIPGEPLYDACFKVFGLPRVLHAITPFVSLPTTGAPFDLITAFMITFAYNPDETPWTAEAWRYFFADLEKNLTPRGTVVLKFNRAIEPDPTFRTLRQTLKSCSPFRMRASMEYLFLSRPGQ